MKSGDNAYEGDTIPPVISEPEAVSRTILKPIFKAQILLCCVRRRFGHGRSVALPAAAAADTTCHSYGERRFPHCWL